jgi:coenzyme F420 hydrogenase subunit beta
LEVWEGYAADPEIRFNGSSGGAVTAIALFCLQHEQMAGVLHIGANLESPLQNVPVFSKNKEELLARTGSRYSPAAPCEKLKWIEQADSPCVFIGKPCDVAALRKSQSINQTLNDKIGLAVSIFCAGTPTTKGTYDLLATLGVKPQGVAEIRYRGYGWPGKVTVKVKGKNADVHQLSYSECWGKILSDFSQFRCLICPDATGEFADIACGDPWHRKIEQSQPGYSLVLVRTEKGREILHRAMRLGYVTLAPAHLSTLPRSQPALLNGRRTLFGRLLAMHLMRLPTPSFNGFSLIENWHQLKFWNRFRPVLAMLWHTISEKLYRPQKKYLSGTITVNEDFASPAVIKTISREET